MGIVHPGVPEALTERLAAEAGITTFVETGTFQGRTAAWAAERFKRVITIEADPSLYRNAAERFRDVPNVTVLHGNSGELLRGVVDSLADPALFWLDAHWSGPGTAGETAECPVLEEIAAIDAGLPSHLVLVDDARMFLHPPHPLHNADAWPDVTGLVHALEKAGRGDYVAVIEDVILRVPRHLKDALRAYVHGDS
ncbi:hypothetical protein [Azospirillum brasilense]|uniref:hypothetical protein n=1 Tax=Azospirillum brasilense TaxID=192 RepID=UPI001EDA1926|nr:hypothetical protein [Azospirillum brasilense]UKJ78108.1 hypothetical protein H1Q64_33045 [Azospirillum brasilense]